MNFSTSEDDETTADLEKVSLLDDILTYLPQIITKSKNVSDGMHSILLTSSTTDTKSQPGNTKKSESERSKTKRVEKLVELISAAVKSRH